MQRVYKVVVTDGGKRRFFLVGAEDENSACRHVDEVVNGERKDNDLFDRTESMEVVDVTDRIKNAMQ